MWFWSWSQANDLSHQSRTQGVFGDTLFCFGFVWKPSNSFDACLLPFTFTKHYLSVYILYPIVPFLCFPRKNIILYLLWLTKFMATKNARNTYGKENREGYINCKGIKILEFIIQEYCKCWSHCTTIEGDKEGIKTEQGLLITFGARQEGKCCGVVEQEVCPDCCLIIEFHLMHQEPTALRTKSCHARNEQSSQHSEESALPWSPRLYCGVYFSLSSSHRNFNQKP